MIDVLLVAALFVLVWVAVLIPPAARGAINRREAFESSLRGEPSGTPAPASPAAHRRQILAGLLMSTVVSLVLGLLPTFRIMLVLGLLLLNSLLAMVALVVHERDAKARLVTPYSSRSGAVASPRVEDEGWESDTLASWRRSARDEVRSPGSYSPPDPDEVGIGA